MATNYSGTKQEERALDVYVKLLRCAEAVETRVNRHLAVHNLTASQFGVLEALYHLGPLVQKDIAKKILKSTGNITLVINNLEKRGLVRRERSDIDRRYIDVYLTEEGAALIEAILPRHIDNIVRELTILMPGEQGELARICRKLGLQVVDEIG